MAEWHGVWIVAEQWQGELKRVSFELLGRVRVLADEILKAVRVGVRVELGKDGVVHQVHPVRPVVDELPGRLFHLVPKEHGPKRYFQLFRKHPRPAEELEGHPLELPLPLFGYDPNPVPFSHDLPSE